MTNTPPNQQLGLQNIDAGDSIKSPQHIGKRDKFRQFLGIPKSKNKEPKDNASDQSLNAIRSPQATGPPSVDSLAAGPPIVTSQPKDAHSDDDESISSNVPAEKPLPSPPPAPEAKKPSALFFENVSKPLMKTALPTLLARIEKTEQLIYCNALLLQSSLPSQHTADAAEEATNLSANVVQMKPTLTEKELDWLTEMDKHPMEKAHIRWLATRMVEEFIQDGVKDSTEIAEIVALGP
ncbi:hypothetical protein BGW39_007724, partial [Mortierella sp. 14UC]